MRKSKKLLSDKLDEIRDERRKAEQAERQISAALEALTVRRARKPA